MSSYRQSSAEYYNGGNNYNPGAGAGYGSNGYGGRSRRGNGTYGNQVRNEVPRKKSGCKIKPSYTRRGTGEVVNAPCITGWKKPYRQPFMKFIAVPNADPSTKKDRWKKFLVKIQIENQAEILTTGFWDVDKKVLRMPDFGGGMVANPTGGPGGYWGKSGPPRNNRR